MQMKFIVILFCLTLIIGLVLNNFNASAPKKLLFACDVVDSILQKDQYYRRYLASPHSPYIHLMDSLIIQNGYEEGFKIPSSVDSKILISLDKQVDLLLNTTHKSKKIILDSINKLQTELDCKNVMQVIDLISKIGHSNIKTIQNKCGLESFIVFVHTPIELCDTVYSIIEKINLKSFNPNRYRHIMWHLNGRSEGIN